MKIKIYVDRAAAIAAGNEQYGYQIVDVPMSALPEDVRGELALLPESDGVTDATSWVDGTSRATDPKLVLATADTDAVIATLRHRNAVREARKALDARKREEHIAAALAAPDQDWITYSGQGPAYYTDFDGRLKDDETGYRYGRPVVANYPKGVPLSNELLSDQRVVEHRERIAREVLPGAIAEWERQYAAWQQLVDEKKARERAATEALLTWAKRHGSERLQLMLSLEVGDWESVAQREAQEAAAPEGYTRGTPGDRIDDRRKPTLAELKELKRLRDLAQASGGVLSDPELLWVEEESDDDESEDSPERRRYCIARIRVHAPDGAWAHYSRVIE
jgi:hypothetical protein